MPVELEALPGLPGDGPYPEQFTTARGTHREGFVVRVTPEQGQAWVGNFQPGLGGLSRAVLHPNGRWVVVISRGQAYVVDAEGRRLVGADHAAVQDALVLPDRLILFTFSEIVVLGPGDDRWQSPQLAWDGFDELTVVGARLKGLGWDAVHDAWRPVEVDLETREVLACAFEWPRP